MEFADVYESFGTKVTIVEALDRILPLEDAEVSKFMERTYKKRGMDIHTGCAASRACEIKADGVTVTFTDKKGETADDGRRLRPVRGGSSPELGGPGAGFSRWRSTSTSGAS